MPHRLFGKVLALATICLYSSVLAESKQYLVEIVVFGHSTSEFSDEIWQRAYTESGQGDTPRQTHHIEFVKEGPMKPAVDALRRRRDYTLFHYSAWIQDTLSKNQAPIVPVVSATENLQGHVQVHGGHLLFVDLTLSHIKIPSLNAVDRTPVRFLIDEKRRVKLNETHYFDHPRFGAIVQVSRQP